MRLQASYNRMKTSEDQTELEMDGRKEKTVFLVLHSLCVKKYKNMLIRRECDIYKAQVVPSASLRSRTLHARPAVCGEEA